MPTPEETVVSFPESKEGQPSPTTSEPQPSGETTQGNTTGTGLTREEVQRLIDEGLQKALRNAQSLSDKAEARIRKEIDNRIKVLNEAGITPTADQVQKIEAKTREQVGAEEKVEAPPKSKETVSQPESNPIQVAAIALMEEFGVQLLDSDPEAKELDTSSSGKWLRSVEKALQQKKDRLAQEARGRTHGTGGHGSPGNPIANIKDIDELYALANKRR